MFSLELTQKHARSAVSPTPIQNNNKNKEEEKQS